jgi:hypothetical protein
MILPAPDFVSGHGVITQACEGDGSEEKRHHPRVYRKACRMVDVTGI